MKATKRANELDRRALLMALRSKTGEAYREAERCAALLEDTLVEDPALAEDEVYGTVCRVLGALEDIEIMINDQLTKLR